MMYTINDNNDNDVTDVNGVTFVSGEPDLRLRRQIGQFKQRRGGLAPQVGSLLTDPIKKNPA